MKPVSIIFGLKSIFRNKQRNFFGILAITLGVSLITGISITNDSLSNGFGIIFSYPLGEVDGSVTSTQGFMNESLSNAIGSDLIQLKNVTAYTQEISLPVTTSTLKGQINLLSTLKGIDENDNTTEFGRLLNLDNKELNVANLGQNETYIGHTLASDLDLTVGQKFNFSVAFGPFSIERELTVKDIVKDEERGSMGAGQSIFMELGTVQQILSPTLNAIGYQFNAPITVIYLKFSSNVKTTDDAKFLINQMTEKINSDPILMQATSVGGISTLIFSADRISIKDYGKSLATQLGMLLTIFGSILIIAGLILIVNIQLMTIENKEKQIGIQRAVGTQGKQIIYSNLTEFVIIGIIGGFFGIVGGAIFGWLMVHAFGLAFDFDGSLIPIVVPSSTYVTAFFVGFLVSVIAGLYPAYKASNINVIEVLRGIQVKEFAIRKGAGLWTFVFGLLLTVLGLLSVMGLSKNPLDWPASYINVNDVEAIYVSTTFLLVGILVLLSYFVSRRTILTITGFALLAYPLFQIFIVFNEIKEGSGGTNYLVVMMVSLIGGAILLVAMNLDTIANISERIFSVFFSAVSMISFKQMSSQKTRSTLTFAIFAIILTLNIFLASWAYSSKYGAENQVNVISGNSDVLVLSATPLSTQTSNQYLNSLKTKFPSITYASTFPSSGPADIYMVDNANQSAGSSNIIKLNIFSINENSLFQNNINEFNFVTNPNKLNTTSFTFPSPYSTGLEVDNKIEPIQQYENSNINEGIRSWEFLSSGLSITNKTSQKSLPVIITSNLYTLNPATNQITTLKTTGDSVWIPLKNGTLQEFVLITTCSNNPLVDSVIYSQFTGTPSTAAGAFIQENWARQLAAFNPSPQLSLVDQSKYFLLSTDYKVKSSENENLVKQIEIYSNGLQNDSFRIQQGKSFGFFSTTVYSLYETLLDGQFRVLQFMQYFTTLGFLFGIVSLLVVSIRSVQERKREIGMMRSIGVKRRDVTISLILELTVMGTIGLLIGLIIGNLLAYALIDINSAGLAILLIPWDTILLYVILTLGSALVASIIPGIIASRIPPSDALRYTG